MSECNGAASVVCPSVCLSVCKLLRKSLLFADKWPDRHQTWTRWSPGKHASRMCSRSRSKVTWYGHFLAFLEWATPSLTVWLFLHYYIVPRERFVGRLSWKFPMHGDRLIAVVLIHWHHIFCTPPLKFLRSKNWPKFGVFRPRLYTLCARSFVCWQIFRKQTTFVILLHFPYQMTPISATFWEKFLHGRVWLAVLWALQWQFLQRCHTI